MVKICTIIFLLPTKKCLATIHFFWGFVIWLKSVLSFFCYLHNNMAIVLILSLFPLFGIFLVFPGLVRWSQTAWFLAELFLRIRARAVSRDNLPAATFPEPATRPKSFFQSKTYFSTAPIIVLACTCPLRVLTCSGSGQKKNLKKSCAIFWQCALHFLELVETLKVPVTEF